MCCFYCCALYDVFPGGYFVFPCKINKASLILTSMTEIEVSHQTNPRWKAPLSSVLASCTSDLLISIPAGAMEAEMNASSSSYKKHTEEDHWKRATASLVADNEPSVDGAFYQTLTAFSTQENKEQCRWLHPVENLIRLTPNRL